MGNSNETCEYFIPGYCAKTRLPCPHCKVDGKCEEAKCRNAVIPTWQEIVDIYTSANKASNKSSKRRRDNVRGGVERFVSALGCTMTDKVVVSDDEVDVAYAKLLSDFSPFTIESTFQSVRACIGSNREIQKEYRKRVKTSPSISFPSVIKKNIEPKVLTPEQRVELNQILSIKRASRKKTDRTLFIWLWFAWRTGMRPSDICRVTWSCIVTHENGTRWIDYVPHKTMKSTGGRKAGGQISEEQYQEIKPFIGNPDDPVIPRYENRRAVGGCAKVKHGEYIAFHLTCRDGAVAVARSIGVKDQKPAYVLRKDCAATITAEKGPIHAAQMLGDNPKTLLRHYVDLHKTELRDGL